MIDDQEPEIKLQKQALIGREAERAVMDTALRSREAEFVALYGRRRVGKTFLVREHVKPQASLFCEFIGQKDASTQQQLFNFKTELERVFYDGNPIPDLDTWTEAFTALAQLLLRNAEHHNTVVVFIDELPWLSTPRSGLVQALDYCWNRYLSQIPQLTLIACGSAASWIIDHLIQAKGGLHNRITCQIKLRPFTLMEVKAYLNSRNIRLKPRSIIELYMAVGGVAHYLRQFDRSVSVAQNIAKLCFSETGILRTEFSRLFQSLFGESEQHEKIVRCLSEHRQGLNRNTLLSELGGSSGGRFNRRLEELEEAGFIARFSPYNAKKKMSVYRLVDPYIFFYLRWIESAPQSATQRPQYWSQQQQTQAFKVWSGYAFETLCLSHVDAIASALGIDNINYEVGSWSYQSKSSASNGLLKGGQPIEGAQIDLLFDRADNTMSLCEIKYHNEAFVVDKSYAKALQRKIDVFEQVSKTKKDIQVVLITASGFKPNLWSEDIVHQVIEFDRLFDA